MEMIKFVLLSATFSWIFTAADIYDITTIYRLSDLGTDEKPEDKTCIDIETLEIHARTNALGVSLYVPERKQRTAEYKYESALHVSPECGFCGWTTDEWTNKSLDYVTSEPTLVASEQESGSCKYDVVQVDQGMGGGPTGIQGRLESPRGQASGAWTIRSMDNQRIKLVFADLGAGSGHQSADLQSYELDDYAVKLGHSERQAKSGRYEAANLTADYVLSKDNYLRVQVEKNIQRSFAALYFFESRDQLTLYAESGRLTSQETTPSADKLCLALLVRTTRALGTVLDVVAQFLDGKDVHLGRWQDVQENKWTYVRFTAEMDSDYTDKDMRIQIIAAQQEGAILYIRKIEECDPDEQQSTVVVKKGVTVPVEFPKSEKFTAFPQELNGKCINGGILTKVSGQCVCPPGFAGTFCTEGCGPNKYGDDCGGRCSSFNKGCKGVVMCKQEVGCDCAPGFRGPLCSLMCEEGEYGFGCRQKCGRCEGGVACDPFTGVCPTGCHAGYFGEICIYKYKYLSTAPVVYTHGPHNLEVVFKKDLTQGRGLPRFYKIQYKKSGEEQWTSRQTRKLEEKMDTVTANITDLVTWTYYDVRVVLVDIDLNSYEGEDVPYTTMRTSCVIPEEVEYYIHSSDVRENSFQATWLYEELEDWCPLKYFEVYLKDSWRWVVYTRTMEHSANFTDLLAGKKHRAKVRAVTVQGPTKYSKSIVVVTSDQVPEMVLNLHQSSATGHGIEVQWKAPRFTAGIIKHYNIIYKCKQLVACPSEDCSYSAGQITVDTTHAELPGLIPHAQYYVSVSAVSGSQGPAAILFPATDYTAPEIAPEASKQYATNRTERSFTVHWQMPKNCTGLNGFLSRYYCELLEQDSGRVVFRGHTENNRASFDGLQHSTQYTVKVYYVTTGGWSRKHPLLIQVRTKSPGEEEASSPEWEYLSPDQTTTQMDEETTTSPTTSSTYSWETESNERTNSKSQETRSHDSGEHRQIGEEENTRESGGSNGGWEWTEKQEDKNSPEDGREDFSDIIESGSLYGSEEENERRTSVEKNSESKENHRRKGSKEDGGRRHHDSEEGSKQRHDTEENSSRKHDTTDEESGSNEKRKHDHDGRRRKDSRQTNEYEQESTEDEFPAWKGSNVDEQIHISLETGSTENGGDYSELSSSFFDEEDTTTQPSTSTTEDSWW